MRVGLRTRLRSLKLPRANRSELSVDRTWAAVGGGGGETLYQDQPRGSIAGRTRPGGDGG